MSTAVNGISRGGVIGNAQAAGASIMTSFIDFFGARNIENHAIMSGTASGNGNTGRSVAYGAATAGEIVVAALVGWTGGGGAAAKGVSFSNVGWYELGSQTINGQVYRTLEALGLTANKVELGKYLVQEYEWSGAIFKTGELSPSWMDWLATLLQGPTPGGYLGLNLFSRQALESWFVPWFSDFVDSWPCSQNNQ
jgi:hypothetical protein